MQVKLDIHFSGFEATIICIGWVLRDYTFPFKSIPFECIFSTSHIQCYFVIFLCVTSITQCLYWMHVRNLFRGSSSTNYLKYIKVTHSFRNLFLNKFDDWNYKICKKYKIIKIRIVRNTAVYQNNHGLYKLYLNYVCKLSLVSP